MLRHPAEAQAQACGLGRLLRTSVDRECQRQRRPRNGRFRIGPHRHACDAHGLLRLDPTRGIIGGIGDEAHQGHSLPGIGGRIAGIERRGADEQGERARSIVLGLITVAPDQDQLAGIQRVLRLLSCPAQALAPDLQVDRARERCHGTR
jgi:hypothetical protein